MPSAEECAQARNNVHEWALKQLVKQGHPQKSAKMIVAHMPYDEQIKLAEQWRGESIYLGPYSPY